VTIAHALRIDVAAFRTNTGAGFAAEMMDRHITWQLDQLATAGFPSPVVQIAAGPHKPPAADFLGWARRVPQIQITTSEAHVLVAWHSAIEQAAPRHRATRERDAA
jgi:hypothetical protein